MYICISDLSIFCDAHTVLLQLLGRSWWLGVTLFWRGLMQDLYSVPMPGFSPLWNHFTMRSSPTAGHGWVTLVTLSLINWFCYHLIRFLVGFLYCNGGGYLSCNHSNVWHFINREIVVLFQESKVGNGSVTFQGQLNNI